MWQALLLRCSRVLRLSISEGIPKRSALVAVVIGTLLNLINQGDALLRGGHLNLLKIALTYAVPYCVATYGAVSYRLRIDKLREPARDIKGFDCHSDSREK